MIRHWVHRVSETQIVALRLTKRTPQLVRARMRVFRVEESGESGVVEVPIDRDEIARVIQSEFPGRKVEVWWETSLATPAIVTVTRPSVGRRRF